MGELRIAAIAELLVGFSWLLLARGITDFSFLAPTALERAREVARLRNFPTIEWRESVTLHIEPGPQFPLGAVQFASGDPDGSLSFTQDQLRRLLALNQGNLFRANRIRIAMESITKFYGSNGFIDCVPMPITAIDEAAKTIDLFFRIDEGRQYRVGKVEIIGMSEELKGKLKSAPRPGDVFNRSQIQEFLSRNKASLPPGIGERSVEVGRDARAGIVNLKFDFWSYPSCAGLTIAQILVPSRP